MADERNNAADDDDETRENRFSHLLQPIKELAQNWNIDIAKELEDYLEELEHITFRFDDPSFAGGKTLNFAEAALLIQGSACVYSKKVEFLYNLSFQTLEMLTSKRKVLAQQKEQSSIQKDGKDADAEDFEEPEFLPLDDILEESQNIDLVRTTKRKGGIVTLRTPSLALLPEDGPEGEPKFRINTGFVHSSGAILLEDERDRLDDTLQENRAAERAGQLSVLVGGGDEDDEDIDGGNDMLDVGLDGNEAPAPQRQQRVVSRVSLGTLGNGIAPAPGETIAMEDDPWRLLDPHAPGTAAPKPFKKKNTCRVPAPTKDKPKSYKAPVWSEFAYLYEAEAKRRLAATAKSRAPRKSKLVPNLVIADDEIAADEHDEQLDNGIDGLYGDAPLSDDEGDALVLNQNEDGDQIEEIARLAERGTKHPASYEDLVREQVEKYVAAAQQYADETALSRRVAQWTLKLEPVLEEQEKRAAFDVHQYGVTVLQKLKSTKKKGPIQLCDLVEEEQKEPYNACRVFVTALHLINNGNIDPVIGADHQMRFSFINDRSLDSEMVGAFGEVVQMVDKTTSKKKKAEKEKEKEEAAKQKGKRVSFAAGKELTQEREFTKDKHEVEADDESDEPPVKKGKQVDQDASGDPEDEIEPIDLALVARIQKENKKKEEAAAAQLRKEEERERQKADEANKSAALKKKKKKTTASDGESDGELSVGKKARKPKDDIQKKNKRAQSGEDAFNEEKENSNAVSVKVVSGLGKKLKALAVKS